MGFFDRLFVKRPAASTADSVDIAKKVLTTSLYFRDIASSGYFPPRLFLNEFLMKGCHDWDQDRMTTDWTPFVLSPDEYHDVKTWWFADNPRSVESDFGAGGWDHWLHVILNPADWGFPNGLPRPDGATQLN
jgi:hypothetical protein